MKIIKYVRPPFTTMSRNDKFQRMKNTGKLLDRIGLTTVAVGFLEPVKKNKTLSTALAITGCTCSIGSYIEFMLSLEEYGLEKEIDETEIIGKILWNVVVLPVANTMSLAYSLKEINKV